MREDLSADFFDNLDLDGFGGLPPRENASPKKRRADASKRRKDAEERRRVVGSRVVSRPVNVQKTDPRNQEMPPWATKRVGSLPPQTS